jgi:hypothetical protein
MKRTGVSDTPCDGRMPSLLGCLVADEETCESSLGRKIAGGKMSATIFLPLIFLPQEPARPTSPMRVAGSTPAQLA